MKIICIQCYFSLTHSPFIVLYVLGVGKDTYTRWGRTVCPTDNELVYKGKTEAVNNDCNIQLNYVICSAPWSVTLCLATTEINVCKTCRFPRCIFFTNTGIFI